MNSATATNITAVIVVVAIIIVVFIATTLHRPYITALFFLL